MSAVNVNICDIRDCKNLASHRYSTVIWSEQENGDGSFATYKVDEDIDMCGLHEYEYRRALPKIALKEKFQNIQEVDTLVFNREAEQ